MLKEQLCIRFFLPVLCCSRVMKLMKTRQINHAFMNKIIDCSFTVWYSLYINI